MPVNQQPTPTTANPADADQTADNLPATIAFRPHPADLARFAPLQAEEERLIADALQSARAENTRINYASQWRKWAAWATERGTTPLPADPEQLARFLARQAAEGRKIATLRQIVAAVNARHRLAGAEPPGSHPGIKEAMAGFARRLAREQDQAAPLDAHALTAIRATATRPRLLPDGETWESPAKAEKRGRIDIALAAVMRDALLRRAEAVALTWEDLQAWPDGSGRLTVRRSKTDQTGEGTVLYLSAATMADLQKIRPRRPEPEQRIFPMTVRTVNLRIKAMCQAAGLTGRYSGHSPRVGMAQDLAADRAELPELMDAGRWKSPKMPATYTRRQQAGRGAVAKYYRS